MKLDFNNKIIIITGGTRGIGAAIVEILSQCNASIIATGKDNIELDKLNNDSSENITYKYLDFTSDESIISFINYINNLDRIDGVVNNAGVNKIDSINDIDENDWNLINNINLKGPFMITKNVSKKMKEQNYGRIINIGSIFGVVSKAKRAAYSATKSGLIGFTRAVALDLAANNILVNTISPGFVDTELTRNILAENEIRKIEHSIPLQRLANVDEIARIVVFLLSDNNTYITGQNIIVDGGFTSA